MKIFSLLLLLLTASVSWAQAPDGIAGGWHFTMDTDGGVREVDATFQVEGTAVTGKWANADVKGTFADGKLDLAFPMHTEEGGFSATLKITGKLDNGELAGRWEFGEYSGTYRAKRKS